MILSDFRNFQCLPLSRKIFFTEKSENRSKSPDPPRNHTQLIKTHTEQDKSSISFIFLLFLNLQLIEVPVDSAVYCCIDGLQSIPGESNDKDVAAMLDELIIEANEESFVIVLQHGGNDVT